MSLTSSLDEEEMLDEVESLDFHLLDVTLRFFWFLRRTGGNTMAAAIDQTEYTEMTTSHSISVSYWKVIASRKER